MIDPYRSGRNGFEYLVSAANVQTDMIVVEDDEDEAWDAVWESAVGLTATGWIVGDQDPFFGHPFSEGQRAGMERQFRAARGPYAGEIVLVAARPAGGRLPVTMRRMPGISDVQSPMRLMLYPYASAYVEHYPYGIEGVSDWSRSLNGGMDVKYGLNDAYTLDMTLVPDFGQVVTDNVVLNLSPFRGPVQREPAVLHRRHRTVPTRRAFLFAPHRRRTLVAWSRSMITRRPATRSSKTPPRAS